MRHYRTQNDRAADSCSRQTVHRLACILLLPTLWGCQVPAEQTPPLDTLREDLARLETRMDAQAEEKQAVLVSTMTSELAQVGSALDKLSSRVATTCQVPAPAECETGERPVVAETDKLIVGQIEHVWVDPPGFMIRARVDTGAHSSSLHAQDIVEFERDGADWVRFTVNNDTEQMIIERPVEKFVRVFQQSDKDGTRRAVVNLRIFLGNVKETFAFTLADRSHLQHGMILGRNFLKDIALVDVAQEYVQPSYKPKQRNARNNPQKAGNGEAQTAQGEATTTSGARAVQASPAPPSSGTR